MSLSVVIIGVFMAAVLIVWGFVAAVYGFVVLTMMQSAVHEILAGVAFIIATISIGLGFVIIAIQKATAPQPTNNGTEVEGLRGLFHNRFSAKESPEPASARAARAKGQEIIDRAKRS